MAKKKNKPSGARQLNLKIGTELSRAIDQMNAANDRNIKLAWMLQVMMGVANKALEDPKAAAGVSVEAWYDELESRWEKEIARLKAEKAEPEPSKIITARS